MFEFECPNCKELLQIPDEFNGKRGRCKKCQTKIVPAPSQNIGVADITVPKPTFDKTTIIEQRPYGDYKNPNVVILQIETTGPSSRKCNMIELASIKLDITGREVDTYWSFCNPEQHIPSKIQDRTGITEDMLAQAPYPFEVASSFFTWVGPNPIIIVNHVHFHAKFLSAPLLREDAEPPEIRLIDIAEWAEKLALKLPDYKLRTMLDKAGYTLPSSHHRALETCKGIHHLLPNMFEKQIAKLDTPEKKTLLGKLLRRENDQQNRELYESLVAHSVKLTTACGEDFYDRQAFDSRKSGTPIQPVAAAGDGSFVLHMPEWFDEKRHMIKKFRSQPSTDIDPFEDHSADAQWEFALIEASQSESPEEKRRYLMRAVDLSAGDPSPYEQMTGYYIKEKNYQSAHEICERYFETENWKKPQHATASLKMLDRLRKLEAKLAEHA